MDMAGHTLDPDGEEYITFTCASNMSRKEATYQTLIISKLGNDSNVNSIQWAVSNFSSPRKTLGSCLWPGFKLEFMEKKPQINLN